MLHRRSPVAALCALTVLAALAVPAHAAFPGPDGSIAFDWSPAESIERGVWTVAPDGSGKDPVVPFAGVDAGDGEWSPDGSRLAFERVGGIWLREPDGTEVELVPTGESNWYDPSWSPDGTQIVYHSLLVGNQGLHVVEVETGETRQITFTDGEFEMDSAPEWSPDGSRIVFERASSVFPNVDLLTVAPDGSELTPLATSGDQHRDPSWSPDGTRIAYGYRKVTYLDFPEYRVGPMQIGVVDADGAGHHVIANGGYKPQWSPSGARVAFTRVVRATGVGDLMVVAVEGGTPLNITMTPDEHEEATDWRLARIGAPLPECTHVGTPGDDVIQGTDGDDVLCGMGGDDRLVAGPGADVVLGGAGADEAFGGLGDDRVSGGHGEDTLWGGAGADLLAAGRDADALRGGPDGDHLGGGLGEDRCTGGDGLDTAALCEVSSAVP
jgi:dipeptidyl aminopeptidase/acylaminoacyl peptidase